ncbi:MAG: NTP transferase domain-containing protein [Phycisphaeraceae bacterium]
MPAPNPKSKIRRLQQRKLNPTASTAQAKSAPPQAIILAAGKGTRMGGDAGNTLPKVVYPVADRPMVWWVVKACRDAGVSRCIVVIGYKGELVQEALADVPGVEYVEQREQLGTGHATRMAEPLLRGQSLDVFVLAGDGPLIRQATLEQLLDTHRRTGAAATLATSVIADPTGYGRVVRDADGGFGQIVEQKDATPEQRRITEVNPSYYCFASDGLFRTLRQLRNDNKQGEYYLTDVPALLKAQGKTVTVEDAVPPEDVLSINTPQQLAEVDGILRKRLGIWIDPAACGFARQ